jgi:hypothetical protein
MKRILFAAALAATSLLVTAQPYGPGPGQGQGPGPGMGKGMGPRFDAQTTPGWAMMNPEERKAHQERMFGFKDPAACQAYMTEHHKLMESRAKEQGKALPFKGPGPGCDYLKPKA